MRSTRRAGARSAAPLVVWLPGAFNAASDFLAAGFDTAVSERGLAVDLEFVDLEMKHLQDREALDRLRGEVLLPARRTGPVWLGGISLGGLLAVNYAAHYPGEIDGLCLLAPYLGNRIIVNEILRAPGLRAWEPGVVAPDDEERRAWRFLKARGPGVVPLHLGFGAQDRFAAAHRLLAEALPPGSVDTIDGGHDWPTWVTLWGNFLNRQFR